ncbi:MAG: type II secretion system protein N [Janthinobacterium lividum]
MKRLPQVAGFVLFLLLCASVAYWAMQWFKPPVRPVAAAPAPPAYVPDLAAASSLFGGRMTLVVASNYQLKGVVVAGRAADSVAIIATDGKPAQAVAIDRELSQGVRVKQVFRQYVMIDEGGVAKRLELPTDVRGRGAADLATRAPLPLRAVPPTQALTIQPQGANAPQMLAPAMPAAVAGADGQRPMMPPSMYGQPGSNPNAQQAPSQ